MKEDRERIAAIIRALRAKTIENGCTEDEAVAAASKLADLLAKYNMTVDEAELRSSPFGQHHEINDNWVGQRLWKVAKAIAYLTGTNYWGESAGEAPTINFFGFEHEVDMAAYLLEICRRAMQSEQDRILRNDRLFTTARQRRAVCPFLDGMADRLYIRIRALKPPPPTGKGLVVLHQALIDAAMPIKIVDRNPRPSLNTESGYYDGWDAGGRVPLNPGVQDQSGERLKLK